MTLTRHLSAACLWESRRPEIERMYLHGEFSQADLADYYHVSQPCILKVLRRLGIPAKHQGKAGAERPLKPRVITQAKRVFTCPGWWNPAPPTGGTKRTVRGLDMYAEN